MFIKAFVTQTIPQDKKVVLLSVHIFKMPQATITQITVGQSIVFPDGIRKRNDLKTTKISSVKKSICL